MKEKIVAEIESHIGTPVSNLVAFMNTPGQIIITRYIGEGSDPMLAKLEGVLDEVPRTRFRQFMDTIYPTIEQDIEGADAKALLALVYDAQFPISLTAAS